MSDLEMQKESSLVIIIFSGTVFFVFSLFFLALGVVCVALKERYKEETVQGSFKEYCKKYFPPCLATSSLCM